MRVCRLVELTARALAGGDQQLVEVYLQLTPEDLDWARRTHPGKRMIKRFEALTDEQVRNYKQNLEDEEETE